MPSDILVRITGDPSAFKAAMDSVGASIVRTSAKVDAASLKFSTLGAKLSSIGAGMTLGITAPIIALGTGAVKASGDLDVLKRALVATTGSVAQANEQFARLEKIAKLPGIGLEEAVRGSIRLQAYGLSAGLAEKALRAFSNAVAAGGGSADDTSEALRQLGQMYGRGKVTMDNLRIILERVPQAAAIIRKEWGAEALADPSAAFEKLGLTSQQVITRMIDLMGDIPPVSIGVKTAIENLGQEVQKSAARIGDKLVPALLELLPKLESVASGAADFVDWFTKAPNEIKNTAIALGLLAVATGPVISGIGGVLRALGTLQSFAGAAGVAMGGLFGAAFIASIVKTMSAIDDLTASYAELRRQQERKISGKEDLIDFKDFDTKTEASAIKAKINLRAISDELGLFGAAAKATKEPLAVGGKALAEHARAHEEHFKVLHRVTLESVILTAMSSKAESEFSAKLHDAIPILKSYSTVFVDEAIKRARALDALFVAFRQLEDAPEISMGIDFERLPKAAMPDLPSAESFEEFVKMGRNVGPEGMLTKEQADAIKDRYKQIGREGRFALQQVSTIMTDLSRGIANAGVGLLFSRSRAVDVSKYKDEITALEAEQRKLLASQAKGNNVTELLAANTAKLAAVNRAMAEDVRKASLAYRALEAGKAIVEDLAKSITRALIEGALKKLAASLLNVGGIFGKVFGGGTGMIKSMSGGGSDLGAAASGGGGAGGAMGGIGGWIGLGSQVVSAVSGVIGNFQFAHMNTALGRIEESTRFSQIHLLNTLNKANEYWPYMKGCWESLVRMEKRAETLAGAGTGGTFNFNVNGGYWVNDSALDELFEMFARKLKAQGI